MSVMPYLDELDVDPETKRANSHSDTGFLRDNLGAHKHTTRDRCLDEEINYGHGRHGEIGAEMDLGCDGSRDLFSSGYFSHVVVDIYSSLSSTLPRGSTMHYLLSILIIAELHSERTLSH
jgi:hypothetical protein